MQQRQVRFKMKEQTNIFFKNEEKRKKNKVEDVSSWKITKKSHQK